MRKILVVAATAIATIVMVGIGLALMQSTRTIPSSGVITPAGEGLRHSEHSDACTTQHVSTNLREGYLCCAILTSTTLDFSSGKYVAREMIL